MESIEIIGCLAPRPGSGLQVLAMVGFVLAARALRSAPGSALGRR